MQPFIAVSFFALGAIFASFVGVLVGRFNTGESIISGRSRCDACGTPLPSYVLIPIISYLMTKGRAVCCGVRISLYTILTEVVLGSLFLLGYMTFGLTLALVAFYLALIFLLALVLYDLTHQILPTPFLIPFIVFSGLTDFLTASDQFLFHLATACILALSLLLIHVLSSGKAMGFADTPFVFGCALLAGGAALSGFVFSFWIGAVIGIIVLFGRPKGSRMGVEVPFAPFLAAGFLLAFFTQWNPFAYVAAFH